MRHPACWSTRFASQTARSAILLALLLAGLSTTADAQRPDRVKRGKPAGTTAVATDSAFAAVQARGADSRAMGVDQYSSVHRFDALPDGGRIELQRAANDSAGVARIRQHLRRIAAAFAKGDFRTPGFVHDRQVPGTAVMAARRGAISYSVRDLPHGGEVLIRTTDSAALAAVHDFIAFQRREHHAGGAGDPGHGMHGSKPAKP